MRGKFKRLGAAFCAGVLLTTAIFTETAAPAQAASEPVKDSFTLTLKYPDTVGEGYGLSNRKGQYVN